MKRLGISQRVERIENYNESRDCLDQRWAKLALAIDFLPIPLPNLSIQYVPILLDTLQLDAIVVSGGNSIALEGHPISGAAPERDAFETCLVNEAIERNIPLLGVCRGMQLINVTLGGQLQVVEGHVACRHPVHKIDPASDIRFPSKVNSFHNYGIAENDLAENLIALLRDDSGYIEAFQHKYAAATGIMWHPEREEPFDILDLNLIAEVLS